MKLTTEMLKRIINEEFELTMKEYGSGKKSIPKEAWLAAYRDEGIPNDSPGNEQMLNNYGYYYQPSRDIGNSLYTGVFYKPYDAMADSGGDYREDLQDKAIERAKEMSSVMANK